MALPLAFSWVAALTNLSENGARPSDADTLIKGDATMYLRSIVFSENAYSVLDDWEAVDYSDEDLLNDWEENDYYPEDN